MQEFEVDTKLQRGKNNKVDNVFDSGTGKFMGRDSERWGKRILLSIL